MGTERGPYKLTPLVQKRITDAITAGNYIETAAAYAGISKDTLFVWLRKGARTHRGVYFEFAKAVDKALADAEVRDVATIATAAAIHWQAAAWRLERKHPDRWARRDRDAAVGAEQLADVDRVLDALLDKRAKRSSE